MLPGKNDKNKLQLVLHKYLHNVAINKKYSTLKVEFNPMQLINVYKYYMWTSLCIFSNKN